jgi:hypothetical protein
MTARGATERAGIDADAILREYVRRAEADGHDRAQLPERVSRRRRAA